MKLISLIVSVLACYAKRELLIVLPVDRRASGSVMSVIDEENDGTGLQEAKVRRRIYFSDFGVNENISGEPPSRHLASAPPHSPSLHKVADECLSPTLYTRPSSTVAVAEASTFLYDNTLNNGREQEQESVSRPTGARPHASSCTISIRRFG